MSQIKFSHHYQKLSNISTESPVTFEKEKYYKSKIGEDFNLVFEEE